MSLLHHHLAIQCPQLYNHLTSHLQSPLLRTPIMSATPTFPQAAFAVSQLEDDHFETHNTECDIYKSAETPDSNTSESSASIVQLRVCRHIFHEVYIRTWLATGSRTCPMCRTMLVELTVVKARANIEARLNQLREANRELLEAQEEVSRTGEDVTRTQERFGGR
jgi:hypothetical protein